MQRARPRLTRSIDINTWPSHSSTVNAKITITNSQKKKKHHALHESSKGKRAGLTNIDKIACRHRFLKILDGTYIAKKKQKVVSKLRSFKSQISQGKILSPSQKVLATKQAHKS